MVSKNKMLRRIIGLKKDEVTGDCTKVHNEELHNFYSSPRIIRMIKSQTMRLAWHVARIVRK
jgi:3-deoxy-D-arabino-heptulosonate 7-phosphate (DAHP) synthase class II